MFRDAIRRRVGQRRDGGHAARARDSLYRAHARGELPRPARQPRQSSRQHAAGALAVHPRGDGGCARARLCAGHGPTARGRAARQRRAHARDDGDLQRVVRSHPDAAPGRRRPARCDEAATVGRLDPHVARSRRAGARLHQMGRSSGIGARRARSDAARVSHRDDVAARSYLRGARRRAAGRTTRGAGALARARALPRRGGGHAGGRAGARGRATARRRDASARHDRPRVERSGGLHAPRRAGRADRRRRADRHQDRRDVSDEASAASIPAEPVRDGRCGAPHRRRRRDPEPRLDRSRRHAAPGLQRRVAARQGHPVFAGSICPQRLQHGLSGGAADGSVGARRARRDGGRARRRARPSSRFAGPVVVRAVGGSGGGSRARLRNRRPRSACRWPISPG